VCVWLAPLHKLDGQLLDEPAITGLRPAKE
jgi:hypothetical protein